jgi:hypothetical protein
VTRRVVSDDGSTPALNGFLHAVRSWVLPPTPDRKALRLRARQVMADTHELMLCAIRAIYRAEGVLAASHDATETSTELLRLVSETKKLIGEVSEAQQRLALDLTSVEGKLSSCAYGNSPTRLSARCSFSPESAAARTLSPTILWRRLHCGGEVFTDVTQEDGERAAFRVLARPASGLAVFSESWHGTLEGAQAHADALAKRVRPHICGRRCSKWQEVLTITPET